VSGSGISWVVCKSAPCPRQLTTPTPHHTIFYRPDALPATQTNSVKALKARDWYTRSHKLFLIRKVGAVTMEAVAMYEIVGYL